MTRSIRLRPWQKAAIDAFQAKGAADFLTVATPGAGKTTFALTAARHVLAERPRSRLIVVAPTAHAPPAGATVGSPPAPPAPGAAGARSPPPAPPGAAGSGRGAGGGGGGRGPRAAGRPEHESPPDAPPESPKEQNPIRHLQTE